MNTSRSRAWPNGLPLLLCLAALALLWACGGATVPDPVMAPVPETSRLFYDDTPAFQDSVRVVIRTGGEFDEIWGRVAAEGVSPPPVDFEQDLVLVVSTGRLTPEDQIRVDSVGVTREATVDREIQDVLTVVVVTSHGCGRFRAAAYPREVVQVRRFDGPVRFVERSVRATNC